MGWMAGERIELLDRAEDGAENFNSMRDSEWSESDEEGKGDGRTEREIEVGCWEIEVEPEPEAGFELELAELSQRTVGESTWPGSGSRSQFDSPLIQTNQLKRINTVHRFNH